jgi:toxin ParE1/3/4
MGHVLGQRDGKAGTEALMTLIWSPEAIADLAALRAYIEQDNPAAAQRIALHVIHNIETLLPENPEMGRPGRVPGTRELVIPKTPFIVPHRLVGNVIHVLRIFHGAQMAREPLSHGDLPTAHHSGKAAKKKSAAGFSGGGGNL